MRKTVYNQALQFEITDRRGARYLMPDGRYYNAGELAEASDKAVKGLEWHKDGNTPWNAGSDIQLTHTSVKSSKFTLASDLQGATIDGILERYFAGVASNNWDYVILVDEQVWIYNMSAEEFKQFVKQFGYLDSSRHTIRGKATSSKTIAWLEARI